jgi:hypothetical protein
MKRGRDELEGSADEGDQKRHEVAADAPAPAAGAQPQEPAAAAGVQEDDEDDKPLLANYKMSRSVRKGAECPYLDTISRQVPPLPCSAPVLSRLLAAHAAQLMFVRHLIEFCMLGDVERFFKRSDQLARSLSACSPWLRRAQAWSLRARPPPACRTLILTLRSAAQ